LLLAPSSHLASSYLEPTHPISIGVQLCSGWGPALHDSPTSLTMC
jgi:hypothetical protein